MSSLELTPDELADALTRAELEVVGRMYYSSNATFLVTARVGGLELPAVYKPRRGEQPLWDFPPGTLCDREVASYEISQALGWDIVPTTVLRDGPLGVGAVQRFVDHDPDEHYFTLLEQHEDRFRRFAYFDVLVNNTDRKGGHCLRDQINDVVVGIDHGLTFHTDWKLRTVIWDFAGETVDEDAADDVCRVMAGLDGGPLAERLSPLVTGAERAAVSRRARRLLTHGLPLPSDRRSMPWPLV